MADNPRVFFDVSIGDVAQGRIKFELFANVVPRTAENFRQLCTGERRDGQNVPIGYKDVGFHRVVRGFMVQGGDIGLTTTFADENFVLKHDRPFLLSMANRGRDTNTSQFFITTAPAPSLDGKHVVFGEVYAGQEIVRTIERISTDKQTDRPRVPCTITQCGEL